MSDPIKLRPVDKAIGAVLTTGVLTAGGGLAWYTLPLWAPLLVGGVAIAVGAATVFGVSFVALDPSARNLFSRIYALQVQRAGLALVAYDPIGTLRYNITQLKKRADEFLEHRTTLKGILRNLIETIELTQKERESFMEQAAAARDLGEVEEMGKLAQKAARRKETFEFLDAQRQQMQAIEVTLGKFAKESNDVIEECQDELSQLILRDKASAAASGALRSAMDILGDDALSHHKEAVEVINERVGRRLAEMDLAMDKTTGLVVGFDVKNSAKNKAAIAAMLEYEKSRTAAPTAKVQAARAASVIQKKL